MRPIYDYQDPGYGYERPRPVGLTTGPVQWDEQALAQARERMPSRVLLNAMLMVHPLGGALRVLRNPLLRDMRLERMFRR